MQGDETYVHDAAIKNAYLGKNIIRWNSLIWIKAEAQTGWFCLELAASGVLSCLARFAKRAYWHTEDTEVRHAKA